MTERARQLAAARALAIAGYDRDAVLTHLNRELPSYRFSDRSDWRRMLHAAAVTLDTLDRLPGQRLADRWQVFQTQVWPQWLAGQERPPLSDWWMWGARALVCSRLVRPSWSFIDGIRTVRWVARLPVDDPLSTALEQLRSASARVRFGTADYHAMAINRGLRLPLHVGVDELSALTEQDLLTPGRRSKGADVLDAMLCQLKVFDRTPRRGSMRWLTTDRHTPTQLAVVHGVPEPFREVVGLYLEHYARRHSDCYPTLRAKARALAHFFTWLRDDPPRRRLLRTDHTGTGARVRRLRPRARPRGAARPRAKVRTRRPRTPGWSTCAGSSPTSAPGPATRTRRSPNTHRRWCP